MNSATGKIFFEECLQSWNIIYNFAVMMTNRKTFIALFSLFVCLMMHGQIKSELAFRRYTTQDGLPQFQAERLWQDSRGYIPSFCVGLSREQRESRYSQIADAKGVGSESGRLEYV
jgi:hypothetical protein